MLYYTMLYQNVLDCDVLYHTGLFADYPLYIYMVQYRLPGPKQSESLNPK